MRTYKVGKQRWIHRKRIPVLHEARICQEEQLRAPIKRTKATADCWYRFKNSRSQIDRPNTQFKLSSKPSQRTSTIADPMLRQFSLALAKISLKGSLDFLTHTQSLREMVISFTQLISDFLKTLTFKIGSTISWETFKRASRRQVSLNHRSLTENQPWNKCLCDCKIRKKSISYIYRCKHKYQVIRGGV